MQQGRLTSLDAPVAWLVLSTRVQPLTGRSWHLRPRQAANWQLFAPKVRTLWLTQVLRLPDQNAHTLPDQVCRPSVHAYNSRAILAWDRSCSGEGVLKPHGGPMEPPGGIEAANSSAEQRRIAQSPSRLCFLAAVVTARVLETPKEFPALKLSFWGFQTGAMTQAVNTCHIRGSV